MTWLLFALTTVRQDSSTLSDSAKANAITEFSQAFEANYVFPEVAKKATSELKARLAAHEYDALKDGPSFVKRVNSDLNAVCHDAHLHLSYSVSPLPDRKAIDRPSPDEIRRETVRTRQLNAGLEQVQRLDGNIGYIEIRGFLDPKAAARPIEAAFNFVADCDALVVDLRRNGGGDPETVKLFCSYLFGSKPVHLNDIFFREGNQTTEFWTQKSVPGRRFESKPVYVLVSHRTGSGAEECAYDLQNTRRATIVGESTWGGANPGGFFRLDDHFNAFIPVGRAINPYTHTNWEGTGVTPDVKASASDAMDVSRKLAVQKLLAEAKDPDDARRLQSVLEMLEHSGAKPVRQ